MSTIGSLMGPGRNRERDSREEDIFSGGGEMYNLQGPDLSAARFPSQGTSASSFHGSWEQWNHDSVVPWSAVPPWPTTITPASSIHPRYGREVAAVLEQMGSFRESGLLSLFGRLDWASYGCLMGKGFDALTPCISRSFRRTFCLSVCLSVCRISGYRVIIRIS